MQRSLRKRCLFRPERLIGITLSLALVAAAILYVASHIHFQHVIVFNPCTFAKEIITCPPLSKDEGPISSIEIEPFHFPWATVPVSAKPKSCTNAAIESAERNAEILFFSQEKLPPLSRVSSLAKPISFFAISSEDDFSSRTKQRVDEITSEVKDIHYGDVGNSNIILVLARNEADLKSEDLKRKLAERIVFVTSAKNQNPNKAELFNWVEKGFNQSEAEVKNNNNRIYKFTLTMDGIKEFYILFFIGQQDNLKMSAMSNRAIAEVILISLGIAPIKQLQNSVVSSSTEEEITAADIALIRLLLLAPSFDRWRVGLTDLMAACGSEN